jgi:hypothetical protein
MLQIYCYDARSIHRWPWLAFETASTTTTDFEKFEFPQREHQHTSETMTLWARIEENERSYVGHLSTVIAFASALLSFLGGTVFFDRTGGTGAIISAVGWIGWALSFYG